MFYSNNNNNGSNSASEDENMARDASKDWIAESEQYMICHRRFLMEMRNNVILEYCSQKYMDSAKFIAQMILNEGIADVVESHSSLLDEATNSIFLSDSSRVNEIVATKDYMKDISTSNRANANAFLNGNEINPLESMNTKLHSNQIDLCFYNRISLTKSKFSFAMDSSFIADFSVLALKHCTVSKDKLSQLLTSKLGIRDLISMQISANRI